jgi:hypothetical protein
MVQRVHRSDRCTRYFPPRWGCKGKTNAPCRGRRGREEPIIAPGLVCLRGHKGKVAATLWCADLIRQGDVHALVTCPPGPHCPALRWAHMLLDVLDRQGRADAHADAMSQRHCRSTPSSTDAKKKTPSFTNHRVISPLLICTSFLQTMHDVSPNHYFWVFIGVYGNTNSLSQFHNNTGVTWPTYSTLCTSWQRTATVSCG